MWYVFFFGIMELLLSKSVLWLHTRIDLPRNFIHSFRWYFLRTSVQFSHSVMSNSLQPYGLQHVRLPCPSPTPGVYSNSCPSSWWCHPTIISSVIPFSSCLQSFPASGSFPMSQFFASGGHSTVASTLASVLPVNIQDWFCGIIEFSSFNHLVCGVFKGSPGELIQIPDFMGSKVATESSFSQPLAFLVGTAALVALSLLGKGALDLEKCHHCTFMCKLTAPTLKNLQSLSSV